MTARPNIPFPIVGEVWVNSPYGESDDAYTFTTFGRDHLDQEVLIFNRLCDGQVYVLPTEVFREEHRKWAKQA